jgi:hypothetical protein
VPHAGTCVVDGWSQRGSRALQLWSSLHRESRAGTHLEDSGFIWGDDLGTQPSPPVAISRRLAVPARGDNETGWVDWEGIDEDGRALAEFTHKLIVLRRALPMLRRGRFLSGRHDEELGVKDVAWLTPAGDEMTEENWGDANALCMGVLLDGRAQETGIRRLGTDATLLLVLNAPRRRPLQTARGPRAVASGCASSTRTSQTSKACPSSRSGTNTW